MMAATTIAESGFAVFSITCGVVTIASSLSIVLTGLLFQSMLSKLFVKIIFYIATCHLFASLFLLAGYPASGSVVCALQGFITLFFFRAIFFWTTALTLELYGLVLHGTVLIHESYLHLVIWSCNAVLAFLAFIPPDQYSQDDLLIGYSWCAVESTRNVTNELLWNLFDFFLPLVLCTVVNVYAVARIMIHYRKDGIISNLNIKSSAQALIWYPILMFCLWLPNIVLTIALYGSVKYSTSNNNINNRNAIIALYSISQPIGSLYGVCLPILYFRSSTEARRRWAIFSRQLVAGKYPTGSDASSIGLVEWNEYDHEIAKNTLTITDIMRKTAFGVRHFSSVVYGKSSLVTGDLPLSPSLVSDPRRTAHNSSFSSTHSATGTGTLNQYGDNIHSQQNSASISYQPSFGSVDRSHSADNLKPSLSPSPSQAATSSPSGKLAPGTINLV